MMNNFKNSENYRQVDGALTNIKPIDEIFDK
jgi:hypothetical protein